MERFHSHNAYTQNIETINGKRFQVFYSYATPVAVYNYQNNIVIKVDRRFSSSTTRQVNRYANEWNCMTLTMSAEDFKGMIKILNETKNDATLHLGLGLLG